jgi:uncharacterized LabA/DUF88 family protein
VSKNVALFVDVANLYYSARGQDVDVDYVALLKTATKGRDLIRAYAYSGLDPENENQRKFIDFLNKNGYKVLTKDIRKFGDGRVKANLDIELVVDLFRLADRMDIAVIVSGDGDFAPAIRALQDKGVRCEVISFRPNTSSDLIAVADEFIDIMKIAGIGRGSKEAKAQRGMSAPEMPAKEVVPEFGFREASPGVAAAALAALREGRAEPTGTRGRSRRRVAADAQDGASAPAVEAEAVTDEAAATDGEQRKRRRRRGGRGRGRRSRGAPETGATGAGAPASEAEIGWVELDDLSQLSELEGLEGPEGLGADDLGPEREYTFEEADEATLAELGIDAAAAATGAPAELSGVAAEAAGAKKPARRRSTRKASTGTEPAAGEGPATQDAGEPASVEKPSRRRRTPKQGAADTAAETAAGTGADAEAAAKPKRTTRSRTATTSTRSRGTSSARTPTSEAAAPKPSRRRTTKADATPPAADAASGGPASGDPASAEEAEGIWQRFRSARGRARSS